MYLRSFLLQLLLGCNFLRVSFSETRHPTVVQISKSGDSFVGKVHVNGESTDLKLERPANSIFSPNFKFKIPSTKPNGEFYVEDFVPSVDFMNSVEKDIYTDEKTGAVFKVEDVDGEYRLEGIVKNFGISHDGKAHFAVRHHQQMHAPTNFSGYTKAKGPIALDHNIVTRQNPTWAQVEIYFVMDYAAYGFMSRDMNKVGQYMAVMFRGVNARFATSPDPTIYYKIVGGWVMTERSYQSFIENAWDGNNNRYDIYKVLDLYSAYAYNYLNCADCKHDLAPLISGENFGDLSGLAWIGGACAYDEWSNPKKSLKTSVNQDQGGAWRGTHTLAHELAHNMGAPHDGDGDASGCSWDNGYIMSYKGWGTTNKFYFSPCSRSLMKNYINNKGKCVQSDEGKAPWSNANYQAGDVMDMNFQCKNFTGRPSATVDSSFSANDLCKNLRCKYIAPCSWGNECPWTTTLNVYPHDNTPCGNGGRCNNGNCQ